MHDAFAALLRQPTARRYKQLRSQLLAAGLPGDFSLKLAEVERLMTEQHAVEAHALGTELLSTGLISLRLHRLCGQLALEQGDQKRAELHRFTYDALIAAILATGNGTRRRPLLVTHASDAVELLTAKGFDVLSQSLIEEHGRRYDVLLCGGEREFWFDVTDLLPQTAIKAARSRRPRASEKARARPKHVMSRR